MRKEYFTIKEEKKKSPIFLAFSTAQITIVLTFHPVHSGWSLSIKPTPTNTGEDAGR